MTPLSRALKRKEQDTTRKLAMDDKSEDFNLYRFPWYNATGIIRVTKWLRDDAASLTNYVKNLAGDAFDPRLEEAMEAAVAELSSAHYDAKQALAKYRKNKPALQAAE